MSVITPSSTTIVLPSGISNVPSGLALSPTCGSPSSRSTVSVCPSAVLSSIAFGSTLACGSATACSASSSVFTPSLARILSRSEAFTSVFFSIAFGFCCFELMNCSILRLDALALIGATVLLIRPRRKASLVLMKISLSIKACISSRSHSHRSTYASTILSCHICISSPWFFKSFAFSWSPKHQPGTHGLCSRKAAFSYALRLSFGAASIMIVAILAALPSTVQVIFFPLCRSRS